MMRAGYGIQQSSCQWCVHNIAQGAVLYCTPEYEESGRDPLARSQDTADLQEEILSQYGQCSERWTYINTDCSQSL